MTTPLYVYLISKPRKSPLEFYLKTPSGYLTRDYGKCCNRGRNAIYVSCFLYPAAAVCRMLQVACCVLQAASRLVYFRVQQYWTTRYIPLPAPCFWLLTLWLLAAYSLPMLLVACYLPLAARCLPASAASGEISPSRLRGDPVVNPPPLTSGSGAKCALACSSW